MKKTLHNKFYLLTFLFIIGIFQGNAQDFEYTFDGTTWEGWGAQGGTGAYVSVFANSNPNDALNVSWPNVGTNTKNIVMYAPTGVQTMSATDYKYVQVQVTNTSSEVDRLNIRGRISGGAWTVFHSEPITTDASATIKTYTFEITNAGYVGTLDKFQIIFKKSDNSVLTANANTDAILVHNILISENPISGSDTTPPVISLLGNATVNHTQGTTYTDAGATASDNVDGDITPNIIVGGDTIDENTAGTYTITYDVSDAAGNAATQVTRTVNVGSGGATDLEFTFNDTTWEGWSPQGGTGAFVSVFANGNPDDALNISWPNVGTDTRNIIMYGSSSVATMNADDRKFFSIKISNTSSEIGTLRIRGRIASGGGFINFIDVAIGQDAVGSFSTYNFEITNANYSGTLDRFQIVFRSASNAVLTANSNTDAILVDNILISANSTLSARNYNQIEYSINNPVKDILTIKTNEVVNKIEIFDLLGRQVFNNTNPTGLTIDVSSLKKAAYILRLTTNLGIATKKFIKE